MRMRMRSELRSKCLPLSLGEGRNSQASSLKDKKDGNYQVSSTFNELVSQGKGDDSVIVRSLLYSFRPNKIVNYTSRVP